MQKAQSGSPPNSDGKSRRPYVPSYWIKGFLDNPEAFKRKYEHTGGAPWPVLPFKVVCKECRSPVDIEAWECGNCGEQFHWKAPRKNPCQHVARQSKQSTTLQRPAIRRRYSGGMCPVRKGDEKS